MKAIRVASIGLLISAILIYFLSVHFYTWETKYSTSYAFLSALNAVSPSVVDVGGMKNIITIAFVVSCLGLGMFLSATLYSVIETIILETIDTLASIGAEIINRVTKTGPYSNTTTK